MKKRDIKTRLIKILQTDVGGHQDQTISWDQPNRSQFTQMGIDDGGDAMDYIDTIRNDILELVKELE